MSLKTSENSTRSRNSKVMEKSSHTSIDPATMLTLKLLYFFYYASVSSVNPFLTVYYSSLGLGSETIGLLAALKPFLALIVTPLWGILADRTDNRSTILVRVVNAATVFRTCLVSSSSQHVWFLTTIVLLHSIFYAPIKSLNDSVVLSFLSRNEKSLYGKIREWGPAGKIISSPLMAYVINNSNIGFQIAFTCSALLSIPVVLCILKLRSKSSESKVPSKQSKVSFLESFRLVRQNRELMNFFPLIFIFGCAFGFIEVFVYVHIKQVFSDRAIPSTWTMSVCRLCMALGGILGFRISGWLMKKVGTMGAIFPSLLGLAGCYFLYASSEHVTHIHYLRLTLFVAEIIRSASFALMWSVATVHVNTNSAPEMNSSALAFMDSVYTGLGNTFGSVFGGKVIAEIGGIAPVFSYVGCILAAVACVVFGQINIKKVQNKQMKKL